MVTVNGYVQVCVGALKDERTASSDVILALRRVPISGVLTVGVLEGLEVVACHGLSLVSTFVGHGIVAYQVVKALPFTLRVSQDALA